MKKYWWKALCVACLSFSLMAGLLIPLGPGVVSGGVTPYQIETQRQNTLSIHTYNTLYSRDSGMVAVRLRVSPKLAVCASEVKVVNDNELSVMFNVPNIKPEVDTVKEMENKRSLFPILEIYSPSSGLATMEGAVAFKATSDAPTDTLGLCAAQPYPVHHSLNFPFINLNEESNRNLFFHVPMWFGMTILMFVSLIFSLKYLSGLQLSDDVYARSFAAAGVLFGILGLITGAIWARFTWGTWWTIREVKLNAAAAAVLVYFAYFILRGALEDESSRARISAVYSVFAFVMLIALTFIMPRMVEGSLHPGGNGNVVFSQYDFDNTMRLVFYPAVLGWTLLGVWLATLLIRLEKVREQLES